MLETITEEQEQESSTFDRRGSVIPQSSIDSLQVKLPIPLLPLSDGLNIRSHLQTQF